VKDEVPSSTCGMRAGQLSRRAKIVRVLRLVLRMVGYVVIWIAMVLAFGLLAALLPGLWWLAQPGSGAFDLGIVSLFAGFIGLFIGMWPAVLGVEWLVQRNDRRARESQSGQGTSSCVRSDRLNRWSSLMRFLFQSLAAFVVSAPALACSPLFSEGFTSPPVRTNARVLKAPKVRVETFIAGMPALEPGDSCEGTAILVIAVEMPRGSPGRLGFEIRQISGTAAPGYMPDYALMPRRTSDGHYAIYYAWTELPRDPDGHVRWNLEIVAVSRDGRRSAPVPLRVASDG
jgi:hypothetical protein